MDMVTVTVTKTRNMVIAVDFDGTIVEHDYPRIGKEKPFAVDVLKTLASEGHHLILYTSRDGDLLDEAVAFCRERGLVFYAVNSNHPPGWEFTSDEKKSAKVLADIYIDDRNLGGIPDWEAIYEMISGKVRSHRGKGLFGRRRK